LLLESSSALTQSLEQATTTTALDNPSAFSSENKWSSGDKRALQIEDAGQSAFSYQATGNTTTVETAYEQTKAQPEPNTPGSSQLIAENTGF
jgi:hypothetical protein